MSWSDELAQEIRTAIASGQPATITVPTEIRKALGERAAERMGPPAGYDPQQITWVISGD